MNKDDLLNKFLTVVNEQFAYELNDEQTRNHIMVAFEKVVRDLFMYPMMKKFVDYSTPEIIYNGNIDIRVELINDEIVTLEDYCDLMTNEEKRMVLMSYAMDKVSKRLFKK